MRKLKNSELNRKTVAEYKDAPKTPIIIIMDNIRSLNNIGSMFRTGDCFIVEKVILCGISATPPHRDIHKTALGATESVDWDYYEHTEDAIKKLKSDGYKIIAIEQAERSVLLQDFFPEKDSSYALVFGHEVKGISQAVVDMCDICIEIPQFGTKHSFNVSVSAGIVLWEVFSKFTH
jgi:23S rRNA (guanosine2251-2'-O)-methyltransferase